MTIDRERQEELQIKSVKRVRDLGEVFTPAATVQAMLQLVPNDIWQPHPSATFLEPSCGDGNFLVAVLDRKLDAIATAFKEGWLPAGSTLDGIQFHTLEALSSIYAVDMSIDNVVGGVPGHERGARTRLLDHLKQWHSTMALRRPTDRSRLMLAARWVVERNIQIGNMLATNPKGSVSGRNQISLVEYKWDPERQAVTLFTTTLGAVVASSEAESSDALTLFGPPKPIEAWSGKAMCLNQAPVDAPKPMVKHARNHKTGW